MGIKEIVPQDELTTYSRHAVFKDAKKRKTSSPKDTQYYGTRRTQRRTHHLEGGSDFSGDGKSINNVGSEADKNSQMNSNKYEKLRKRNIEIQEESLKKIMPLAKQLSKQLSERSEKIKADKHKKSVKFRDNSKLVENNNRNKNSSSKIPNKVHATNTSINLNELAGMSTSNTSGTIENDDDSLILPNLANVSNLDGK